MFREREECLLHLEELEVIIITIITVAIIGIFIVIVIVTNVMTRNSSNATSAQELWLWHHCCLHQSPEVMNSDDRGDLDVNDGHATMMLYCYIAILLYCYIHGFQPAAWAECYLPSQMGAGKPDNLPQVADDGDGDVANDDDGDHQLK